MAREVKLTLIGDSASLEKAFKKSGTAADSFSAKINSSSRSVAKGALVAGTALSALAVTVGVKSVQAASNLGEQINKVGVVFGKSSESIKKWATTTASSIGISNRAALEAAGTFGNMLVPMGFARQDAAKMSKRMVQLAADLASFNNASPEETLDALRAGLAGETEPLRRFGVFLSADRIKAEALGKGIVKTTKDLTKIKLVTIAVDEAQQDVVKSTKKYGAQSKETQKAIAKAEYQQDQLTKALKGTVPTLTAQQKAQATYSILLKDTSDAQGDFGRTSSSLPNLMRSIRASVEDLSAAFGEGLLPVVQKVAKDFQEKLANPAFRERIRALGKLVGETLFRAFEAISKWFSQNWDGIKNAFRTGADLAGKMADAGQRVFDALKQISQVTPGGAGTLAGIIISGVMLTKVLAVLAAVKKLQTALAIIGGKKVIISIAVVIGVAGVYGKMKQLFEEAFGSNFAGPKAAGDLMPVKRKGVWVDPSTGVAVPNQKFWENRNTKGGGKARGGPVMPGVSYTVGENGPETFVSGTSGRIIPNSGISIGVVHVHGVQNVRELLSELQRISKHGAAQQRGRYGGSNLALG